MDKTRKIMEDKITATDTV